MKTWSYFSSPPTFYRLAGRMATPFFVIAALLAVAGLYEGLVVAPTDAQQGEVYRVIFIHVPAAWMSMWIYFVMACYGGVALVKMHCNYPGVSSKRAIRGLQPHLVGKLQGHTAGK